MAAGGSPIPDLAPMAAAAALASRTNTLFSIPMLFFMGAASHLPVQMDLSKVPMYFIVLLIVVAALQINGMKGKMGPMTTVKGVITSGFILTAVIYGLMEIIL